MSAKILRAPTRRANTIDSIFIGNYARSSHWFESGFTGNIPKKQPCPLPNQMQVCIHKTLSL